MERCDTAGDDDHNSLVNETCARTNQQGQTIASSTPVPFASPEDGSTRAYDATGLPTGLRLDSPTGNVFGEFLASGSYPVTVSVMRTLIDGTTLASSGSFRWTVTTPPALAPRQRMQDVRDVLARLPPTGNAKADKHVKKAVKEINKSLDERNFIDDARLDVKSGKKVFDHQRRAVKALLKILDGDTCGGVERLVLQYTGAGPVDIAIFDKKKLLVSFPDAMSGDLLEIDGSSLRKGKLPKEVTTTVDGKKKEKIHTSCSRPIAEGDVHGDFVIDELDTLPGKPPKKPPASATIQAMIQTTIAELVAATQVLAQTRLDEVRGLAAADPDRQAKVDRAIAKAEAELVKAAANDATGRPDKAISHYKKAWDHLAKAAPTRP